MAFAPVVVAVFVPGLLAGRVQVGSHDIGRIAAVKYSPSYPHMVVHQQPVAFLWALFENVASNFLC